MQSSSGTGNSNEPEVGILLDLGSPFNTAVQSDINNEDTLKEATIDPPNDGENVTERCSQESETSEESPLWADVADEHLIESEQFDFDLPVSPVESAKVEVDDDDEVFFGPVGLTEACIAKKTQLKSQSPSECKPMSPLNMEQYVELFLEANKVAMELTSQKESDGCDKPKELDSWDLRGKEEGGVGKSEQSSASSKVTGDQTSERDGLASLPGKAEVKNFKRLVRKEMRSPRRGTYTISVSLANTPPPPHLPSADNCISKLTRDKPETLNFTAVASRTQPALKAPQSQLPVRGTRRSKLPMKGGLKKMIPPPNPSGGVSTDKLLQKKLSSPPKRKQLTSSGSEDLGSETSSVASETSEMSGPLMGVPKGKRPQPGSFHTKGTVGLRQPAKAATSSAAESDQHKSTAASMKAPAAKPSLLQQGSLQRRMVQANRPLKLVKPGQLGSLQLTSKPQPVKAVAGAAKVPSSKEVIKATPKKAASIRQTPSRLPSTPSTPVHLDKKVVPKRLLTSEKSTTKPAGRSLSASTLSTPQSKLVPPSTPSRSDSRVVPASAGSARRRSGIPTPSRRSIASSSRLSSTSNSISNPSPMRFRGQRSSTTTSSPSGSPLCPKPTPLPAKEGAIKLDLDSSPACTKEVTPSNGRPALETKTNLVAERKSSPVVGLLIDINTDASEEKLPKASVCQESVRNKENLIDL